MVDLHFLCRSDPQHQAFDQSYLSSLGTERYGDSRIDTQYPGNGRHNPTVDISPELGR
ncbi:hypothetical protein PDTA9759_44880 [Phytobacter diazotrophicus]|uniref:Uncharacterized protein n=1 Tax=Phytobacter diazotrophicus TaxID=395631 RepID=A0ABM7W0F5_9ENTR|nr:hypothetical protein PDTA9734_44930 [Phytobacter diazotrophicus]BEG83934.1 hypothetical protein PDTA9730_43900 [Phytobacter diazotrophicus]BEG89832.1 hypothetical protein PDTA9759_44880 [Phytobacter diazotrophicus]BEG95596.1 hypothetical protein PDTA9832_44550 [Phytobacter diazotrophicus]